LRTIARPPLTRRYGFHALLRGENCRPATIEPARRGPPPRVRRLLIPTWPYAITPDCSLCVRIRDADQAAEHALIGTVECPPVDERAVVVSDLR